MFRLLGFLLGSAVSIIAIFMLLGMPEFHLSKLADDNSRFDAAVEKLKEKQHIADELMADAAIAAALNDAQKQVLQELPVADEPAAGLAVFAETLPEGDVVANAENQALPEDSAYGVELLPPPASEGAASWYAFWNPFRSELAARGFVTQLEKVTGLDYRIVKVKAGVYQVAFAYADDRERLARLSQIQAATGLDLSGT